MPSTSRVYAMLGNESLWDVATECHRALQAAGIPYAIVGGVAVCLHGYQRNTVDLDLLVRSEDAGPITESLAAVGMEWDPEQNEFRGDAGVPIQMLKAGERAGKGAEVCFPDPSDATSICQREGLAVLTLARLIEAKLACGEGNVRRTHKDFADVVELVAANSLGRDFARHLHKSLRKTYRELVLRSRGEA